LAVPLELGYPLKNNLKIIAKEKFVKAISDSPRESGWILAFPFHPRKENPKLTLPGRL